MEKIILASNSPRRREILSNFIDFTVISKEIDEIKDDCFSPWTTVMALAYEKGIEVAKDNVDEVVLSADTLVELDGKLLGKPKNREDAKIMIKSLSGKIHNVYTGYAIFKLSKKIKYVSYDKSSVKFYDLSDDEIEKYLDTLEYKDKAGAYGIQGKGSLLVEKIEGDYFNIVGFPIGKINRDLMRLLNLSLW
ncbi:MAG: nucleoside triphosphate pyrophosphatase [Peptoniphilus harei]|uniref:nucleoside triphosphate pyrophosphatase n=1 Tax=uncultured Peptoniphilus sp. TaxID=254354 RepID=UPI002587BCA7|nr:nucleoside triphosphate pyrophosphatase [uncultured Peptoniphilus sp.]MBS6720570.1 septum formation protein Maf [Peptoniphilus harei]MDU5467523.1 nucleoside triphosphate pyrophosphatase [Peptoniphilus harei]MDU6783692.1 nucleoside triphosphate pyrophosphatase [Peptoniphilus harei]